MTVIHSRSLEAAAGIPVSSVPVRVPGRWRCPKEQPVAMAALLLMVITGMEVTGIQPVLLSQMVIEGRLSNAQLGIATTAELMAIAAVLGIAGAFLRPCRLRMIAGIASLSAALLDILSLRYAGMSFILCRAFAGIAEGMLVWIPACMIARAPNPAFWAGVSLTLQCVTQLLFAAVVPFTLMPIYGANGGLLALSALALMAMLAAALLPDSFAPLGDGSGGSSSPSLPGPAGLAALFAVFMMAAFAIGLFAYLGPLASQSGLSPSNLGIAISVALGAMICGAIGASLASKRLHYYAALLLCLLAYSIVLLSLTMRLSATQFILLCGLYGFFQTFLMPFQLPLVIEADPTRRAATILPGIQLLGAASGPLIASFFVTDTDAHGALAVCSIFLVVAFVLASALHFRSVWPRKSRTGRGTGRQISHPSFHGATE